MEKELQIARAYAIGMSILQQSINETDPSEKEELNNQFLYLCQKAKENMEKAALRDDEYIPHMIDLISNERFEILKALAQARETVNSVAEERLKTAEELARNQIIHLYKCLSEETDPGEVKVSNLKFKRLVFNNVAPDSIDITINEIITPKPSESHYRLCFTHPFQESVTALSKKLKPGKNDFTISLYGLNKEKFTKAKNPIIKATLTKISKGLLFGMKETDLGTADFSIKGFSKGSQIEGELLFSKEDKFRVFIVAKMKEPLLGAEVEDFTIPLHYFPSLSPKAEPAKPKPEPPTQPKVAPVSNTKTPAQKPVPKVAPQKPNQIPEFRLLEEWEYERFISGDCLKFLNTQSSILLQMHKSSKVTPPEGLIRQKERVEARFNELSNSFESGEMDMETYLTKLKESIAKDKAKLKELDGKTKQDFSDRIQLAEQELKMIMENSE